LKERSIGYLISNVMYQQCKLHKEVTYGNLEETIYIPVNDAIVGKIVKIQYFEDLWVGGWIVQEVYGVPTDCPPEINIA